jgi:hypothetical protein
MFDHRKPPSLPARRECAARWPPFDAISGATFPKKIPEHSLRRAIQWPSNNQG